MKGPFGAFCFSSQLACTFRLTLYKIIFMARIERKLEQIRLQHTISEILWKDNEVSSHFDYHVNPVSEEETIKLNLLTYNPRHDEYMLLHSVAGSSSVKCLKNMLEYLKTKRKTQELYSFTIKWQKKGDNDSYVSYFRAASEEEAAQKFLHEKNALEYEYTIQMNAVS